MNNRATDVAEMIGHNNPPPVAERLAEDYSALIDAVDALALRANKAPKGIEDDDGESGKIRRLALCFKSFKVCSIWDD